MEFTINLGYHKYLEQIQNLVKETNDTITSKVGLPTGLNMTNLNAIPESSNKEINYPFSLKELTDEEGNKIGTLRKLRENVEKMKRKMEMRKIEQENDDWLVQETDKLPASHPKTVSFLHDWKVQLFNFIAAVVTLGLWIYIIVIAFKMKKMHHVLYTELFRSMFTLTEAKTIDNRQEVVCTSTVLTWIFTVITLLGILVFLYKQIKGKSLWKGIKWDNTSEITLIISNGSRYIPIKVKKLTGYAYLYKIRADLGNEDFELQKHCLWDLIYTKWHTRGPFLYYKDVPVRLPNIIPVSLINKYRLRNMSEEQGLNYQIMIKQNNTWYTPTVLKPIFKPQVAQAEQKKETREHIWDTIDTK